MFGKNKAPGIDGISPQLLHRLGPETVTRLTNIYRASIILGITPRNWLEAKVIFLPKPGKTDFTSCRSWRPISLLTFLLKGLERVWLWHLEATTLLQRPLSASQHGFRRNRSCDSCLTSFVTKVEYCINKNQYVLAAFMDMTSAYDLRSTFQKTG